ncbi:MAG: hypothetical protein HYY52_04870 [Candidatus Melainabacteria bacterium]|nr:hypothetical protein [Candidatus Melainabacteria bacterium]
MIISMDFEIKNEEPLIAQLSLQQLIDLVINSDNEQISLKSRQELIARGKDNIPARITIKKLCKALVINLEEAIKKIDFEKNMSKRDKSEEVKLLRSRFLTLISIVDKLQLEWQKHDISLKKS